MTTSRSAQRPYNNQLTRPIVVQSGVRKLDGSMLYGVRFQMAAMPNGKQSVGLVTSTTPALMTATIEVLDNSFPSNEPVTIYLGQYQIISGVHYAAGVDTDATAQNLADCLSRISGWTTSVLLSTITLSAPPNLAIQPVLFEVVHTGTTALLGYSPTTKELLPTSADPAFGPVQLLRS